MTIKGWSDTETRVPRLGEIKLGIKTESGYPKAVDYFVAPNEVKIVYGEKPRELDIVFVSEQIEEIIPSYLKRYGKEFGLICRGDGETASISANYAKNNFSEYGLKFTDGKFYDKEGELLDMEMSGGKYWVKIPCNYKECRLYKSKTCREVAMLNTILTKVPGVVGVYKIDTGSYNSYQNIKNALLILKAMLGRISFIPLKLKVRMQSANPAVSDGNGGAKQIKTTVPVMFLDMGDLTLEKVIQMAREKLFLPTIAYLPKPTITVDAEVADDEEKPDLLYGPFAENQDNGNDDDKGPDGGPGGGPKPESGVQEETLSTLPFLQQQSADMLQTDQPDNSQSTSETKTNEEKPIDEQAAGAQKDTTTTNPGQPETTDKPSIEQTPINPSTATTSQETAKTTRRTRTSSSSPKNTSNKTLSENNENIKLITEDANDAGFQPEPPKSPKSTETGNNAANDKKPESGSGNENQDLDEGSKIQQTECPNDKEDNNWQEFTVLAHTDRQAPNGAVFVLVALKSGDNQRINAVAKPEFNELIRQEQGTQIRVKLKKSGSLPIIEALEVIRSDAA